MSEEQREMKDNGFNANAGQEGTCPGASEGKCGSGHVNPAAPGKDRNMIGVYFNDLGVLPNENTTPRAQPYGIPGPSQMEFVDSKVMLYLGLPKTQRNEMFEMARNFREAVRPSEVDEPNYTQQDIVALALNARTVRAYVNQVIRALRFARSRMANSYSRQRMAALVGAIPSGAHSAMVSGSDTFIAHNQLYSAFEQSQFDETIRQLRNLITVLERDVMYFDLPIMDKMDDFFAEVYFDACYSSSAVAFFCPEMPVYNASGNKVVRSFTLGIPMLDILATNDPSMDDFMEAVDSTIDVMRGFIQWFNTPEALRIRHDASIKKGLDGFANPYARCFRYSKDLEPVNESGAWEIKGAQVILSNPKSRGSMLYNLSMATPLYFTYSSMAHTQEMDWDTFDIVNQVVSDHTALWRYMESPAFSQRGYRINTFSRKVSRDERLEICDFMFAADYEDDGSITHKRTVKMLESRGYFVGDIYCSFGFSYTSGNVQYGSIAKLLDMQESSTQSTAVDAMLMLSWIKTKAEYIPEITKGGNFASGGGSYFGLSGARNIMRIIESDEPIWDRKKLLLAVTADAAVAEYSLSTMMPHLKCGDSER